MSELATNTVIPPIPASARPRRSMKWLWAILIALVAPLVVVAVLFFLAVIGVVFCFKTPHGSEAGEDDAPSLRETWSYGKGEIEVARIPVRGLLVESDSVGFFESRGPVESALRQIRAATKNHDIRAIILEVDSPGGGITASDLIHHALMDFKKEVPGRKVVAILGDMAASGGYYVAVAADYIVAQPTTLTGSFGVLISQLNFKGLGDQYGVKLNTIKSGRNKDLLSPFSEMTDEQRKLLQDVVDEMHRRFVMLIARGRPGLSEEDVLRLADGRVFTGPKALEYKLVDEVGYWDDAVARTRVLLGAEDIKVIKYSEEFSLSSLLAGIAPAAVRSMFEETVRVRIMSLWQL